MSSKKKRKSTPAKQNKSAGSNRGDNRGLKRPDLFVKRDLYWCIAVFIVTMAVYMLTLSPTVYFGDSGELTAAAYNLGVAHPPGYPLYLLMGKIFSTVVPVGEIAMRMNLMSALFASLTAVLLFLIGRALCHGRLVPLLTALLGAFSLTFWSHAVVTEVYTLSAFFFCALILLTLLFMEQGKPKWLFLMALTAGLGLTHHVVIGLFYPVFFVVIWLNRNQAAKHIENENKFWLKLCVFFLAPLLLYFYLPISSSGNPLNDWGNPESLSGMYNHVTAKQFKGFFLKHGMEGVVHQSGVFLDTLWRQFPVYLLLLALLGLVAGLRQNLKGFLLLLTLVLVNIIYALAYYVTDIQAHFITIFLVLALFMGKGLHQLNVWLHLLGQKWLRQLGTILLTAVALLPLGVNYAKANMSDFQLARNYSANMLKSIEKNGVLFIDGEMELFSLAYARIVEKLRPDVNIYDLRQNIFFIPAMKEAMESGTTEKISMQNMADLIRRLMEEKRPIYFTNPVFANLKYSEHGLLYKVLSEGESGTAQGDPWETYNLEGIHRRYQDAASNEALGKYFLSRARYYVKVRHRERMNQYLEKAVHVGGDRHLILKQVSLIYMSMRRFGEAEKLLKKAIKLDPFDSDDYNMLGMIAHHNKNLEQALQYYSRVLELRENLLDALKNRGILYEQLGDGQKKQEKQKQYYQKGIADLETYLKTDPANETAARAKHRMEHKLKPSQHTEPLTTAPVKEKKKDHQHNH